MKKFRTTCRAMLWDSAKGIRQTGVVDKHQNIEVVGKSSTPQYLLAKVNGKVHCVYKKHLEEIKTENV